MRRPWRSHGVRIRRVGATHASPSCTARALRGHSVAVPACEPNIIPHHPMGVERSRAVARVESPRPRVLRLDVDAHVQCLLSDEPRRELDAGARTPRLCRDESARRRSTVTRPGSRTAASNGRRPVQRVVRPRPPRTAPVAQAPGADCWHRPCTGQCGCPKSPQCPTTPRESVPSPARRACQLLDSACDLLGRGDARVASGIDRDLSVFTVHNLVWSRSPRSIETKVELRGDIQRPTVRP